MANRKKENPRTSFIIFRATKKEKLQLEKEAKGAGLEFSRYMRNRVGLQEQND